MWKDRFEGLTKLEHDQGHIPPRRLPMNELKKMADFLIRQYERKNGKTDVKSSLYASSCQ